MFLLQDGRGGGRRDGRPDGTVVYSATDLASAAACEFALLRDLDVRLGRAERLDTPVDATLERAARLGDRHEERVLAEHLERFGPYNPVSGRGVAVVERPGRDRATDPDALVEAREATLAALRGGADVVFQAGFFDGRFGGWADFLVRADDARPLRPAPDGAPVYAVQDTKLARREKPTALLQLAAYADQLIAAGIPVSREVHLVLGDRTVTHHRLADLLPVYRERRARLEHVLDTHQAEPGPVSWDDERYRACGRCDACAPEAEARRDLLLVAGMRATQRDRLRDAGVRTVEELAAHGGHVPGLPDTTLENLRAQARLQAQQDAAAGSASGGTGGPAGGGVVVQVRDATGIQALPAPDPGDVFFDFEGDPLWAAPGTLGTAEVEWGLEYLFGLVEAPVGGAPPVFRAWWAHDRAQERRALLDFLAYVAERRERHPGMHVYHYAAYEKTALLRLAGRHGVGEAEVDRLLRDGVLVDLYATVRRSLRTGQRSYSLKKLEPIYMAEARSGEVTTAGDSIDEYARACALRDAGDHDAWAARLAEIADYNEYDCLATLGLRDWLLGLVADDGAGGPMGGVGGAEADGAGGAGDTGRDTGAEDGLPGTGGPADAERPDEEDPLVARLRDVADDPSLAGPDGLRTPDQQAVAMVAAALGYHQREDKPFWWAHYDRLASEPADWTERRSTFVADPGTAVVVQEWQVPEGRRTSPRRRVRMTGRLEPGSEIKEGAQVCALYEGTLPDCATTSSTGHRGWTGGVVTAVRAVGTGLAARDVVEVEESLGKDKAAHDCLPMALGPGFPPRTERIRAAIRAVAEQVARASTAAVPTAPRSAGAAQPVPAGTALPVPAGTALPVPAGTALHLPAQPAVDLLRRTPPRLRTLTALPPAAEGDDVGAITAALRDLDGSYLAVQGPPGTGKTWTGSHVIAALVAEGWRVGVVAQSHAVVEHLLGKVVAAGVPADRVGKKPADPAADVAWQRLTTPGRYAAFYDRPGGLVVGGTAWDLTHADRLPATPLDLVVIDEAGQFSLAATVAVSTAGRNLLLLGDPQQLPQVSQGRHPEPVDTSALGWLTDGHETLPPHLGYFLARTWRMHPALTDVVSRLSYEDRLSSVPGTAERRLHGVAPGVRCVRVDHNGNAVESQEEAAAVVEVVRDAVGRRWQDPAAKVDRPLTDADVIVVAAYNAQVWTVRRALDAAGFTGTAVGTVDRFQGREAPVAVLTTAASSPADVPRGMEFLLNRNRLNVALSRGQWCAVVVRSAGLTDHLPHRPTQLEELGAFIGVCEAPDPG